MERRRLRTSRSFADARTRSAIEGNPEHSGNSAEADSHGRCHRVLRPLGEDKTPSIGAGRNARFANEGPGKRGGILVAHLTHLRIR